MPINEAIHRSMQELDVDGEAGGEVNQSAKDW
jgi:hypothetical protein